MQVLIIEDEALASKRLKQLIQEINNSIKILDVLDSIESTVKWFNGSITPELIFMDIQLADGLCFEIFNRIKIDVPIIFTTAFDEYAIQAFKVNSVDYLLKPINKKDLEQALIKYEDIKDHYSVSSKDSDIQQLLQRMSLNQKVYRSRFLVKTGQTFVKINSDNIAYFFVDNKLTYGILTNNKKYLIDYTLDELENELDPQVFFRINRQFILNINSIESVHIFFGGSLKLHLLPKCEEEVLVSRRRVAAFKEWMNK
jgi:two-component system, LytTR family, response regulator LytT